MNYWMCSDCKYIYESDMPGERCPECGGQCDIYNVTCYIPECGGPGHIDERLVMDVMKEQKLEQHRL